MTLPTFLVIGAQKAGTTSLHGYLAAHPQVFVAAKEPSFFTDLAYHRGLDWYRSLFASAPAAVIARGDVSPHYAAYPAHDQVPERVAATLPGVKLIYLLRHPVQRTLSAYRFMVAMGRETRPVDEAVFADPWTYLRPSEYALQLERWLPHVDRDDLLVLTSEQLRADRTGTMRRIFAHIGVDPDLPVRLGEERNRTEQIRLDRPAVARIKATRWWRAARVAAPSSLRHVVWRMAGSTRANPQLQQAAPSPQTLSLLVERFRPDLARLRDHLGPDFHCWGLLDPGASSSPATS